MIPGDVESNGLCYGVAYAMDKHLCGTTEKKNYQFCFGKIDIDVHVHDSINIDF